MQIAGIQQHSTHSEFHALGSCGPELSRHDNLTTLRAALHDEPQNTIACPPDGQAVEQLISQALALSHGAQTSVLNLRGVQADAVLRELEALLDQARELADPASLLAEHFLGVGCADDDVGDGGSDADFDAGIAFFGELALEKFIEFGVEDTVGDELALLGAGECQFLWSGTRELILAHIEAPATAEAMIADFVDDRESMERRALC